MILNLYFPKISKLHLDYLYDWIAFKNRPSERRVQSKKFQNFYVDWNYNESGFETQFFENPINDNGLKKKRRINIGNKPGLINNLIASIITIISAKPNALHWKQLHYEMFPKGKQRVFLPDYKYLLFLFIITAVSFPSIKNLFGGFVVIFHLFFRGCLTE